MNNKGAIFSGFMYVLLIFFLLSLATLLSVLNNSKKISNKARDGAENIIKEDISDFTFDLKGVNTICLNLGESYQELPEIEVEAKDYEGRNLTLSVSSDFIQNLAGTYTVTYTAKNKGKEKSVERKIHVIKNDYSYENIAQEFIAKCDGFYTIELWGSSSNNGAGGYVKGTIKLNNKEKIYIYTGQKNLDLNQSSFNGGTGTSGGYPGGGATDIRLLKHKTNWYELDSLKSRIMVAGGAGAGNVKNSHGGGLIGVQSGISTGGTQTSPGIGGYTPASFGVGGGGCGGGGGYYGAGGADCAVGGAGGSGFISGLSGVNAITNDLVITHTNNTLHYSGKYFVNNSITTGIGSGEGMAKIIYVGKDYPKNPLSQLNNVRYIKDCINGSDNFPSTSNDWIEIQAIKNGVNLALGKLAVSESPENPSNPYSLITDGIIDQPASYGSSSLTGPRCVTIDLGKSYDVDEIGIWHRYSDQATFTDTFTSVSSDNLTWQTIMSNLGVESPNGFRINAWN